MRPRALILALPLVAAFGALAHEGVKNPAVMARMMLMTDIKDSLGVIAAMAKGDRPFDATEAENARQALLTAARKIPAAFESPETDPKSEARPEIWSDWEDFTDKAEALTVAARDMNVTALASLQEGLVSAGQTCRGCHKPFREKK